MAASSSHHEPAVAGTSESDVAEHDSQMLAARAQVVPTEPQPAVVGQPMLRNYPRDIRALPLVWMPANNVEVVINKTLTAANLAKKFLRYCLEHNDGSPCWYEIDLTQFAVAEEKLKIPWPHRYPDEFRQSLDLPQQVDSLVG